MNSQHSQNRSQQAPRAFPARAVLPGLAALCIVACGPSSTAVDGGTTAVLDGGDAFAVGFVGSNFYTTTAPDGGLAVNSSELFITLLDSDASAQWQQVCASVNIATLPAHQHYVQLELINMQSGATLTPGTFSVHMGSSTLGIVMMGGAGTNALYASDGQITLTALTTSGSATGSFSVTIDGGQLSGTFSNTNACNATAQ